MYCYIIGSIAAPSGVTRMQHVMSPSRYHESFKLEVENIFTYELPSPLSPSLHSPATPFPNIPQQAITIYTKQYSWSHCKSSPFSTVCHKSTMGPCTSCSNPNCGCEDGSCDCVRCRRPCLFLLASRRQHQFHHSLADTRKRRNKHEHCTLRTDRSCSAGG